jgi:hypothetical protein
VGVGRENDLFTAAADLELHGHVNVDSLATGVRRPLLAVFQFGPLLRPMVETKKVKPYQRNSSSGNGNTSLTCNE